VKHSVLINNPLEKEWVNEQNATLDRKQSLVKTRSVDKLSNFKSDSRKSSYNTSFIQNPSFRSENKSDRLLFDNSSRNSTISSPVKEFVSS